MLYVLPSALQMLVAFFYINAGNLILQLRKKAIQIQISTCCSVAHTVVIEVSSCKSVLRQLLGIFAMRQQLQRKAIFPPSHC